MTDESFDSQPQPVSNQDIDKFDLLKREVDGLQIALTSQKRIWYKDVSTIISVLALAFSFGTTLVSYHRAKIQDVQASRQELRILLQRLAAIPRENLDASKRFAGDAQALTTSGQISNQENAMLARQAVEVIRSLPVKVVSATEYYDVAVALQNSYDLDGAKKFLDLATGTADTFNDEIAAIRTSAGIDFATGQPQSGRVKFQKALNIFQKYPNYDPFTKAFTNVYTELFWAQSEAGINQFSLAAPHLANAEQIVQTLPYSPGAEGLKMQVQNLKQVLARGIAPATPQSPQIIATNLVKGQTP